MIVLSPAPPPPPRQPGAARIPPAACLRLPGETQYFPVPQGFTFQKGHAVTIKGRSQHARGFVHSKYQRGSTVVYHVYTVTRGLPDLSGPEEHGIWMLTVEDHELLSPMLHWGLLPVEYMWWKNSPYYLEDMRSAEVYSYWPAPKRGWQEGDYVSVPSLHVCERQCARVVVPEKDGLVTVVHQLGASFDGRAIKSTYPVACVLGPAVEWLPETMDWPQVKNDKRARSMSPLSLGEPAVPVPHKRAHVLSHHDQGLIHHDDPMVFLYETSEEQEEQPLFSGLQDDAAVLDDADIQPRDEAAEGIQNDGADIQPQDEGIDVSQFMLSQDL